MSPRPVLVTFIANDCGPCWTVVSALKGLASEVEGMAKVVTIDIDHNPESRARYNIHGLPTLLIFVRGEVVARRIGAKSKKDDLKVWLDASIDRRSG